jgi:hypothetical protein
MESLRVPDISSLQNVWSWNSPPQVPDYEMSDY